MTKLFLFDIDGTILTFKHYRSREIFSDMIFRLFKKRVKFENMPNFAGMTDLQILKEIAAEVDHPFDEIEFRIEQVWADMLPQFKKFTNVDHIVLMPGIVEIIDYLKNCDNVSLGLCTGNFRENAYLKLSVFGLDKYFPFGAFGSDHENRNELPPIAVSRANKFSQDHYFDHTNTIIVGDSPRDIECAKANDMSCIITCTGYFSRDDLSVLNPDYLVNDFSDFEETKKIFMNYIDE
jgi:phosphoglycolate phosphatase